VIAIPEATTAREGASAPAAPHRIGAIPGRAARRCWSPGWPNVNRGARAVCANAASAETTRGCAIAYCGAASVPPIVGVTLTAATPFELSTSS